ncbi:MAG: hypothetical protein QOI07_922 [Verrucomicrobiota bacterium]|jgi:hypothetical protein
MDNREVGRKTKIGRIHGPEWRNNQSTGLKRAWASGKFRHMKRPDYKAIGAKNRGKKRPTAAIEATRKGVKAAWERGVYNKPETVAKRTAHLKSLPRPGASRQQMDKIRAMRDLDALRPAFSAAMKKRVKQWKKDGTWDRIREAHCKKLLGSHGFGRGKRGRLDHYAAKRWVVRDPYGNVHLFDNLNEWSRRNEELFHDDRPGARLPFAQRISAGIKHLSHKRVNNPTSYKGWVLVSSSEQTADPLGRDQSANQVGRLPEGLVDARKEPARKKAARRKAHTLSPHGTTRNGYPTRSILKSQAGQTISS